MVVNVPMNNALDALDASTDEGRSYWRTFSRRWTVWNNVRTLLGTVAATLLIVAVQ
jgi:uncharacterized membrane protein